MGRTLHVRFLPTFRNTRSLAIAHLMPFVWLPPIGRYVLSLTGAVAALALTRAMADSQEALEIIVSEVAITSLLPPTMSQ
jgi:hypothetical protein